MTKLSQGKFKGEAEIGLKKLASDAISNVLNIKLSYFQFFTYDTRI